MMGEVMGALDDDGLLDGGRALRPGELAGRGAFAEGVAEASPAERRADAGESGELGRSSAHATASRLDSIATTIRTLADWARRRRARSDVRAS
jgi:hypothetical protein